jgi:hypothetical protein
MLVSYVNKATMAKQTGPKRVWDGNRGVDKEDKKQKREENKKTKYNHPLLAHTINQSINIYYNFSKYVTIYENFQW